MILKAHDTSPHLHGAGAGFLLNVHGQHLGAETQVLGLIDELLVGRHGLGAHHHVTLGMEHIN